MAKQNHSEKENLVNQILDSLFKLITTNVDKGKFMDEDAICLAILLDRYGKDGGNKKVTKWLQKGKTQAPELFEKPSSELFQKVSVHIADTIKRTTTVITGSEVTISKGKIKVKK